MRITIPGEGETVVMFPYRDHDDCAPYGVGADKQQAYGELVDAVVMYLEAPWTLWWRRANRRKVRQLKAWRARQPINVVARAFRGWLARPTSESP